MNGILKTVNTASERNALLVFLDEFETRIFEPSLNLSEFISLKCDDKFKVLLLDYFGDSSNSESILSKLKSLREELKKMKKITLTLKGDADNNTIDIVKKSIADTTDEPVIIEFVKDPSIIGGASIEKDGYIFEHSFRNYFEKRKAVNFGVLKDFQEVKNGF